MLSDETYLKILKENRSLQGRILKENISEEDNPRLERYLEDVQNEGEFDVTTNWKNGIDISLGQKATGAAAIGVALGAAVIVGKLIAGSYRFYKDQISKYGKKCNDFKHGSSGRKRCESVGKIKAMEARIKALTEAKKYCNKSKDPKLCIAKLEAKIRELSEKLAKRKNKFAETYPSKGQGELAKKR